MVERIMTIGNLLTSEAEMPQLEILVGEETYWLSPFRLYSFQVSASPRGEGDYGSTQVFGLGNVIDAVDGLQRRNDLSTRTNLDKEEFLIEMMRGQIALALMGAFRYLNASKLPNISGWGDSQEKVTEFIKACIAYTRDKR